MSILGKYFWFVWLISFLVVCTPEVPASAQEPAPRTSVSDEESDRPVNDVLTGEAAAAATRRCESNYRSGKYAAALPFCQRVLEQAEAGGNVHDKANARYRVGAALDNLNQRSEALRELQRSREEASESGALAVELYALNRQGKIYQSMGNSTRAIAMFTEALTIDLPAEEVPTIVHARANRGAAQHAIGAYGDALVDLEDALRSYEAIGHKNGLTSTAINVGLVHQALGDYRYARENFTQALSIAQEPPSDTRRIGEARHNLGYLAGAQGDYAVAREHYSSALDYYGQDDPRRATTLNNLGVALGELGNYDEAEQQINSALDIARVNNQRNVEGHALDSLATIQAYQGRQSEALANYQRSLLIKQETRDREGQRETLANIGKRLIEQDQIALATLFYKRSVNVTEAIRNDFKSLSSDQQRSYATSVSETYRELSSLLIRQNRLLEAQRVIDLLKLQELQGYLGDVRGNEQSLTGVPQTPAEEEILEEYDALAARAIDIGRELAALREIPRDERTSAQIERMDELEELQTQLNEKFVRFIESDEVKEAIEQVQGRIGDEAIELSVLKNIGNKLKALDHPAVVLLPLILSDRLELVLATPESRPIHRSVDVSREDLREKVFEFRQALLDPTKDPKDAASKLYDWLIRPLESELQQLRVESVLYAPDDALRYVPLSAFYDGNHWLIERFRVSNWTDSSRENLSVPIAGQLKVLGGAYTVTGHKFEVGGETFSFSGLQYAGKEMETIANLFDETLSFPGAQFIFDDIYRERADFNILHLATHAAVVVGQPSDSFILFGDGTRKSIQDVKNLNFDLDLAVLSACETAVTGTLSNGVEVLGLGYAMQQSGARSTIASLWSVSDGGTHALMSEFYRQLKDGKSKAVALQRAQQLLITNDAAAIASANRGLALTDQVASRLSHPYYWAPFIIVGSGL